MDFANDHAILDVQRFVLVEASVVHGVVIALRQKLQFSFLVCLLGHNAMHDWNVLALQLVDDNIAIDDWSVFGQYQHIASLHGRLHGT